MLRRWTLFALFAVICWVALAPAASAQLLGGLLGHKDTSGFKTYGKITSFQLDQPLEGAALTSLSQFPLQSATYYLYPTASSGEEGMVPGNTVSGAPLTITVSRGLYDRRSDSSDPLEFQAIKSEAVSLPKAPGGQGLLVYSVLYTGNQLANCTGIVQVMELKQGHLLLADQFSYDCRGGAGADWDAGKRRLTIRSARYSLGDQPCCPSQYDSVVFKLDGATIKTGDITVNNQ